MNGRTVELLAELLCTRTVRALLIGPNVFIYFFKLRKREAMGALQDLPPGDVLLILVYKLVWQDSASLLRATFSCKAVVIRCGIFTRPLEDGVPLSIIGKRLFQRGFRGL